VLSRVQQVSVLPGLNQNPLQVHTPLCLTSAPRNRVVLLLPSDRPRLHTEQWRARASKGTTMPTVAAGARAARSNLPFGRGLRTAGAQPPSPRGGARPPKRNVDTVKLVEGGDEPGRLEEVQVANPEACATQGRVLARSDQPNARAASRGTGRG
jgi:hypothetical protein